MKTTIEEIIAANDHGWQDLKSGVLLRNWLSVRLLEPQNEPGTDYSVESEVVSLRDWLARQS